MKMEIITTTSWRMMPMAETYTIEQVIRKQVTLDATVSHSEAARLIIADFPKKATPTRCETCRQQVPMAAETLTPRRRLEYVRGLRSALVQWRHDTGMPFTALARRAGVRRDTINDLINRPTMRYGPRDSSFYEKLYQVELEEPGYFTPEVRRYLRVLSNQ